jgi:hypothetical protein
MFTLACLWVRGHVPFGVEYVERLKSMAERFAGGPFKMVCLTDRPGEVPDDVDPIIIKPLPDVKAWWNKIFLFHQAMRFRGRVVYLDLDVLLVKSIKPIVEYPEFFTIAPHAGTFNGSGGLAVVKKFNSSVMAWDAGARSSIFELWNPEVAKRLWGDQDWIGELLPGAATMPLAWFPRLSEVRPPWSEEAKIVLCKKPKNHDAVKSFPWFAEWWR